MSTGRIITQTKIGNTGKKQKSTAKSTATLASILATTATAVPTKFLSSLLGIGDDVVLKLEDWATQTKKIWLAKLKANGAKTVDLEALFLPQIYKFYHDEQAIQVLVISSFGPFGEILGMAFFEFLKALFHKPPLQLLIKFLLQLYPTLVTWAKKIKQQQYWELTII